MSTWANAPQHKTKVRWADHSQWLSYAPCAMRTRNYIFANSQTNENDTHEANSTAKPLLPAGARTQRYAQLFYSCRVLWSKDFLWNKFWATIKRAMQLFSRYGNLLDTTWNLITKRCTKYCDTTTAVRRQGFLHGDRRWWCPETYNTTAPIYDAVPGGSHKVGLIWRITAKSFRNYSQKI